MQADRAAPLALSGVVLPDVDPPARFVSTVREVEAAGLRAVWTYDHLSWRDLRDGPWHATVPLLAAAAVATERIRLGPLVATPNLRHPVLLAKDAMTLDALSGGRLDLGIGAGGAGADATVFGGSPWSAAERADRFSEFAGLLDALLRQPRTDSAGVHYSAVDARQLPGSVQRPRVPLTIAAAGPRALAVAARLADAWVTYGPLTRPGEPEPDRAAWIAGVAEQGRRLDDALSAAGRPREQVRRLAQLGLGTAWAAPTPAAYDDLLGALRDLGVDEVVVHWPRPDGRGLPAQALAAVLAAHGLA